VRGRHNSVVCLRLGTASLLTA